MVENAFLPVIGHLRASAERFPARPAFVGPDAIAYRPFHDRVRAWSGLFAAHGLEKGGRVAIWLPKRLDYVTALYAAMEAGGIYVPMDGSQPVERAKKILAGAAPTILVTDRRHHAELDGLELASLKAVFLVDGDEAGEGLRIVPAGPVTGTVPADVPAPEPFHPGPDDIAAILFTSGSTGIPKGVQISYGNLHSFIGWAVAEMDIRESDVLSNHAGFHFDLSTFDLFAAAATGAAVWIVREEEQRNVAALVDGIRTHGVTVWYSVPSVLTLLVSSQALGREEAAGLRYVLFAGEVFPIKHMCALKERLPEGCGLYNLYGPTETNVCLYYKVRESDLERTRPVYIGKPLPGLTAEIVDEDGNVLDDPDAIGELVMSGPCVTPGYFQMVEPRNHGNHKLGRHATGDLVGYEDGHLYYYGRKDRMVKVNGNRVELGEIEAALSAMPQIREVAVVAELTETAQNIVACYSLEPGAGKLGVIAIKQHCSRLLPRYMIPKQAYHLEELPKNQNGKIDYLAVSRLVKSGAADGLGAPERREAVGVEG
jgi:L-proline---[L-prolyl-carrier protein] ligase